MIDSIPFYPIHDDGGMCKHLEDGVAITFGSLILEPRAGVFWLELIPFIREVVLSLVRYFPLCPKGKHHSTHLPRRRDRLGSFNGWCILSSRCRIAGEVLVRHCLEFVLKVLVLDFQSRRLSPASIAALKAKRGLFEGFLIDSSLNYILDSNNTVSLFSKN